MPSARRTGCARRVPGDRLRVGTQTSRSAGSGTQLAGPATGWPPPVAPAAVAAGFAAHGPFVAAGDSPLVSANLLNKPIQGIPVGAALNFLNGRWLSRRRENAAVRSHCKDGPKGNATCPSVIAARSCEIYVDWPAGVSATGIRRSPASACSRATADIGCARKKARSGGAGRDFLILPPSLREGVRPSVSPTCLAGDR